MLKKLFQSSHLDILFEQSTSHRAGTDKGIILTPALQDTIFGVHPIQSMQ